MIILQVFALVLAPALAPEPAPHPIDGVLTAIATDYHLSLPDTLTAGENTVRLENRGKEVHQLLFARLAGNRTAADLVAAFKAGGPPPAWETDMGGPNAVDPGHTSLATTVRLEPGHYAAICVIPGPDGIPHIMKGMASDVVVRPGATHASLTRKPDATVTLFDYGYRPTSPVTTSTRTIAVVNDGKQSHELALVRLAAGKTPADLAHWAEKMQGPPPAMFLGGVSPIAPGQRNELSLDLTPGHYVMMCFLPDAKDGKPHLAHGMVHDFVVK
jgi:uncharacterized cupredoxin-like copper-binding protein